jgi:UTP--glucose-1-phosphate uridylyltransferase
MTISSSSALFTPVRTAIFPVAGLGTRFLPATKAQPKEMLPVVDKPLIQYAVEEAYEAGIRHMVFVTGRNKRAIEDHFDAAYELENELEAAHKNHLLALVRSVQPPDMRCSYVRQPRALGLGHAVWCTQHLVGNHAFAVLLADDLMVSKPGESGVLRQMVTQFERHGGSVLAIQEVTLEEVSRYGVIGGSECEPALWAVERIVEKPQPKEAPSRWAVAGRYVLSPSIFEHLARQERGVGGEIQLTDGIAALLDQEPVYAYAYQGKRYDCGSKLGFLQATLDLGLIHPETGPAFGAYVAAHAHNKLSESAVKPA